MFEFKGFTELANDALNYSIESAQKLGHVYIGSEHILLGVLSDEKMDSFKILSAKGVTLGKVEKEIKRFIGIGMPTTLILDDMTPRCKRIVENALALGKDTPLGQSGTNELLISLLNDPQCLGCKILNSLGVESCNNYNNHESVL